MSDLSDKFPGCFASTFLRFPEDNTRPPRLRVALKSQRLLWHFLSPSSLFPSSGPSLSLRPSLCSLPSQMSSCQCRPSTRRCQISFSSARKIRCISGKHSQRLCTADTLRGEAEPHAFSIACKTQSNHPPALKRQRVVRGDGEGGVDGGGGGRCIKSESNEKQHGSWRLAS